MPGPTVARCLAQRELTEPRIDPSGRWVAFGSSHNGKGNLSLVDMATGQESVWPLDPEPALGRGFGGGCFQWLSDGSGIVYAGRDGGVWEASLPGRDGVVPPCRVDTQRPEGLGKLHGVSLSSDGRFVAAVDSLTALVVVERATGVVRKVEHPHAFTLDPVWHDNTVYWQCWSQPHMPWDESEIWSASAPSFTAVRVLGTPRVSVQQFAASATDRVGVLSDVGGWLQPCTVQNGELTTIPIEGDSRECGGPQWGGGLRSWCWSPDGSQIAVARNLAGFGDLAVVDVASGSVRSIARAVHGAVSWSQYGIVALRSGAVTPTQVVHYAPDTFERRLLASSALDCVDGDWSEFSLVEPTIGDVDGVPYRLYEPADGKASHLIIWIHGGPTDQWQVTFMPRIAHWVGRGCRVMVVDHRGTTGHGRSFQQALNGHWGELDTADVVAATRFAHANGWGTTARTIVMGGSAGGFVALNAVGSAPEMFSGVIALYPVVDLADLIDRSWMYERHSVPVLVGDGPANTDLYLQRSPLSKLDSLCRVKVMLMHGDLDDAVPLDHSVLIADQLRRRGGEVSLHVFEGEGHGFRLRENQEREYGLIGDFLRTL